MERRDEPLVTVVIPSLNQGRFIRGALDSILCQEYPHVEIIVMDGGSSDGTVEILREYDDRLAYWVSEPDRGQADAIRRGFDRSRGRLLAWLNCDDSYLPQALGRVVREFLRHPDSALVYGDYYLQRESGTLEYKPKVSFEYRSALYAYMPIPQPSCFMSRTAYFASGGIDPEFHLAMDFDLFLRMARQGEVRHVSEAFSVFRVHETSKSVSQKGGFKAENQRVREKALGRPWTALDDVLVRLYLAKVVARFLFERGVLVTRRDTTKA